MIYRAHRAFVCLSSADGRLNMSCIVMLKMDSGRGGGATFRVRAGVEVCLEAARLLDKFGDISKCFRFQGCKFIYYPKEQNHM